MEHKSAQVYFFYFFLANFLHFSLKCLALFIINDLVTMNNAGAITVTCLITDIVIESFEYQHARLILDNKSFTERIVKLLSSISTLTCFLFDPMEIIVIV